MSDPEGTPVQFESTSGPPTKIVVTDTGGRKHSLLVQVTVVEVLEVPPTPQAPDAPQFNIRAGLVIQKTDGQSPGAAP
jgi:hypothetical protein